MKISVSNLGAIKEATVEVGGLTVFVGANGTGKSYLAKVLYGLQQFKTFSANLLKYSEDFQKILFGKTLGTTEEIILHLHALTPNSVRQLIPAFANLHAELFKNSLDEYFNDDTNIFSNTTITYLELEPFSEEKVQHIINEVTNQIEYGLKKIPDNITPEQIAMAFYWIIFLSLEIGYPTTNYFPAARSNFMLTYKTLYRARADEHVGLGLRPFLPSLALESSKTRKVGDLIRFDKPTEDFLSQLYDLDSSQESPLASVANKLQTLLYGKDQLLVNQAEGALPDFRYQVKNTENKLRLHLTSSMVTETSPLLIGLKHWVEPNSLLIIDEPESHLHPEAQRALVNGLAEAVNQGLKVILITHSPYILSCVNNLIKFGRLIKNFPDDDDVQTLQKSHPDMVALEKKVTAYHFGLDGMVKDIVLSSGLIDEAEFTEPFDRINEIYETMRDIEWEHRT